MNIQPDTKIKDIIISLLKEARKENSQHANDSINLILNDDTHAIVAINLMIYSSNGPTPEIISIELKRVTSDDSKPH